MPRLQLLTSFTAGGGYRPVQTLAGPDARPDTPYRGKNFWIRPGGRVVPVKGVGSQLSSQNLGARIFPIDQYRGEVDGAQIVDASNPSGYRLPKTSLVRYNQSALFFVSELASQQVYINESTSSPYTMTGVTTSPTAGKLRVAVMSGTTFNVYDAGIQAPAAPSTAKESGGSKAMDGVVSIVQCEGRIETDTFSNPSPVYKDTMVAASNQRLRVTLSASSSGCNTWRFGGTDWARGDQGPWKTIRDVRVNPEGTIAVTSGSATLTGTGTRFQRDFRAGDLVTIDGSDYTIATITSDIAGTLTSNSTSTGSFTATMKQVVLEWRNGEIGPDVIEFDNDVPPLMDGIAVFNNVLFGWKNNEFYPGKIGNPEAFPNALQRTTQGGGNIVGVHAGDGRIYLLTTNGLEVVSFTQNPAEPFLIRQVWNFGFEAQNQAVVVDGTLYAAVGTDYGVKIIRTRVDDSPDLEFSADVESDMKSWVASQVIMTHDPASGALLAMYWQPTPGARTTTVLPFLMQQGIWSFPHEISNQVVDAAVVNNNCELIVYDGTNYRAFRFENGNGSTTEAYCAWPFIDPPIDSLRKVIKRLKFTGKANTLRLYVAQPGQAAPVNTSTGTATVSHTLDSINGHHLQVQTNIPNAQSYSVRVDSTGADANFSQCDVWGYPNLISR